MNRTLIALAVLAACDDGTTTGDTSDTADTTPGTCPEGTYVGATIVNSYTVDCVETEASIAASLAGLSASGSAVIFMQETGSSYVGGQWSEEHPLDTDSFDECGFSEELGQVIETLGETNTDNWIPGSVSVFTCGGHLADELNWMTYAVYVEDIDDGAPDCLVTGHDPAGLIAGDYDDDRVGVEPSFALSGCIVGI